MSTVAVYNGNIVLYWNSIIITLGIVSGFLLGYSLYIAHFGRGSAMWVFLPFAIVLSVVFCRLIHYFCYPSQYSSLASVVFAPSEGGYCLGGVVIGVWLAAWIAEKIRLTDCKGKILDALAPGLALTLALIRLSDIFTSACRGKEVISRPAFQRLPVSSPVALGNGGAEYHFATFFMSFLALMILMAVMISFYLKHYNRPMKEPCPCDGNAARLFVLAFGLLEMITDSTRNDAAHLKFSSGNALGRLFTKASGFIGVEMLIGAVIVVSVMVFYTKMSKRINRKNGRRIILWIMFVLGLAVFGGLEWLYQRLGFPVIHLGQAAGLLLLFFSSWGMYRACMKNKKGSA